MTKPRYASIEPSRGGGPGVVAANIGAFSRSAKRLIWSVGTRVPEICCSRFRAVQATLGFRVARNSFGPPGGDEWHEKSGHHYTGRHQDRRTLRGFVVNRI